MLQIELFISSCKLAACVSVQCPVSSAVQVLVLGISGTRSVQGLLLSQLTDCSSEEVQITLWNRLSCRKCFTSELWWFWFFVCLGGFCVGGFFCVLSFFLSTVFVLVSL